MIKVRVPASSANMGPGFDCMGIALDLYSEVCIEKIDSDKVELEVLDGSKDFLPVDKRNYVYAAMERVFSEVGREFSGYRITIDNAIPITRGLGSSSSGIVAGLSGANYILGNPLTDDKLLKIGCDIEGHPDNVAPALFGGFVVSFVDGDDVFYVKTDVTADVKFVALIPDFYFRTKKSRNVLPKYVSHKNAVYNVAHAAYVASAFMKGDFTHMGSGIKDKLHQSYRISHIKDCDYAMELCRRNGADACYLSGAGPTVMSVITGDERLFVEKMNRSMRNKLEDWRLVVLHADNDGVKVFEE